MEALMKQLDIRIPKFRLNRQVKLTTTTDKSGARSLEVSAMDLDGTYMSLFTQVEAFVSEEKSDVIKEEPFIFALPQGPGEENPDINIRIRLSFYGHYGEPVHPITYTIKPDETETVI
eukprot:TRINITY_DN7690_c0_g1_i1.p1 TRINITY_DN7690_c0_g1~~TRINITY_DN7690_c0_g1_i1.p1  ORF type:complete len:118 (+),score=24.61 TRINITY_DN7690_c0_g1_i1:145-498(+)